jgi:hypothetical protein
MKTKSIFFKMFQERAGHVAQGADCLLCKCEALSSKPSLTKKK